MQPRNDTEYKKLVELVLDDKQPVKDKMKSICEGIRSLAKAQSGSSEKDIAIAVFDSAKKTLLPNDKKLTHLSNLKLNILVALLSPEDEKRSDSNYVDTRFDKFLTRGINAHSDCSAIMLSFGGSRGEDDAQINNMAVPDSLTAEKENRLEFHIDPSFNNEKDKIWIKKNRKPNKPNQYFYGAIMKREEILSTMSVLAAKSKEEKQIILVSHIDPLFFFRDMKSGGLKDGLRFYFDEEGNVSSSITLIGSYHINQPVIHYNTEFVKMVLSEKEPQTQLKFLVTLLQEIYGTGGSFTPEEFTKELDRIEKDISMNPQGIKIAEIGKFYVTMNGPEIKRDKESGDQISEEKNITPPHQPQLS